MCEHQWTAGFLWRRCERCGRHEEYRNLGWAVLHEGLPPAGQDGEEPLVPWHAALSDHEFWVHFGYRREVAS